MSVSVKQEILGKLTAKSSSYISLNPEQKQYISDLYRNLLLEAIHVTQQIEEDIDAARGDLVAQDLHNLHGVLAISIKNVRAYYAEIAILDGDKRPISAKLGQLAIAVNKFIDFMDELVSKYSRQYPELSDSIRSTREIFIPEYKRGLMELSSLIKDFLTANNKAVPKSFGEVEYCLQALFGRFDNASH